MKIIKCLGSFVLLWMAGAGLLVHAQSYNQLWKQVEQAQEKSLPQTAVELADRIYRKGLQEHNAPQMLKAYVCRADYQETLTPDSFYTRLPAMEQWARTEPDAVNRAILYSLLANEYAGYAKRNRRTLLNRTAVEGDDLSADFRLWTSAQFVRKVDACCTEALRDSALLLNTSGEDYVPFVEIEDGSRFYGHDLYHLLTTRAIDAYESLSTFADSLVAARVERIHKDRMAVYRCPGREDALVLSTLAYWQNDRGRYYHDAPAERSDSAYLAALDALIECYGERPVCAEVYLAKAEWLISSRPSYALRVCEEGIKRYASYKRVNALRNLRSRILQPALTFTTETVCYPGDSLQLSVSYRHMNGFTLNLYRTNLTEYELPDNGFDKAFLRKNARCISSRHFDLKPNPKDGVLAEDLPYVSADTLFKLPMPDEVALYVVQVVPDNKGSDGADRHPVVVSRLMPLTLSLPGNQVEILALDRKTGHPVPGAVFSFYSATYQLDKDKLVTELTTDADGRARLAWDKKILSYVLRKGSDAFLPLQRIYYGAAPIRSDKMNPAEKLTLLTDRSLYRPGQTVYVKGIAYEQDRESARVLEGKTYTVVLLDANRKEVAKQEVRTNDYGSFFAEFLLPTSCLNGDFMLKVGSLASSRVRVEEYKRPTFSIAFDPVGTSYQLGDTVMLTGRVEAYNGAAIQEVPLAYTVTRQEKWGRAYSYWLRTPETLAADTVRLDAEGRFSIPVYLKKESEDKWYVNTLLITASVTGDNGETQTETRHLSAMNRLYDFSYDLGSRLCKEDTLAAIFRVQNLDGQDLDMQGTYRLYAVGKTDESTLVRQGVFTSGKRLSLDEWKQLPSGNYRLELAAKGRDGKEEQNADGNAAVFLLFSKHDSRLPVFLDDFMYGGEQVEFDEAQPAVFYYGTSHKDAYVLVDVYGEQGRIEHGVLQLSDTLMRQEFPYKESYGKGVNIRFTFVKDGHLHTQSASLTKREPSRRLDMKWEVFRDHLRPGQQEEWKLVVKTAKGLPAAAEVLATMYDASLDQLFKRHQDWGVYFERFIPYYNWSMPYMRRQSSSPYFPVNMLRVSDWAYDHFYQSIQLLNIVEQVAFSIADVKGSNRVLTTSQLPSLTGAVERDEAMLKAAPTAELAESVVRSEAGASLASSSETLEPLQGLRTNFAETAFFYPQLRTNEQGELLFSFTVPESLTRWNFCGYAHTKDMQTALLNSTVTTSKEFMLMPNLPRFVRVGDETCIAATVSNLTQTKIKGTAILTLFDPQTDKVIAKKKDRFTVEAGRTVAVKFTFDVTDRYDLLGVRIVADGGDFSDGEQHVLPVLSNKTFVTETLAMPIRGGETRTFALDSLFNRQSETATDRRLTVEFTGNPAWLAVQALPALGEPTSEDALSRAVTWYANSLAAYIAASNPRIRTMLEAWKMQGGTKETLMSRLEQNQDLKNILLEETPWLTEAKDESEQMARLATLFDVNTMSLRLSSSLNKLREMQDGDGAWGWYPGMPGSRYVTEYILSLLVRLPLLTGEALEAEAAAMRDRAFGYLHREVRQDYLAWLRQSPRVEVERLSDFTLDYLYLLALANVEVPVGNREAYNYYFSKVQNELTDGSITRKSQALVILQKAGKSGPVADLAASLREHLIHEDELGAHFAFIDTPYRWGMMPVSTHVSAMEALRLAGGNDALLEEMKLWLLQQKKTTTWDTPVSAADAVYALLAGGRDWLADRGDVRISLGKELVETLADAASVPGLSYVRKTYTDDNPAVRAHTVTVEKRDQGTAWGAVYAQYLSPMSDLKQHGGELSVDKQLYVERIAADGRKTLEPLAEDARLSVGDILVSRITLRLDRAMDFVQLKDQRAACLEPVNALSGYRSGQVCYYEEVGDAATHFFFDALGKGVYVLEHRQRVARDGIYAGGIATLQCAYAPEYASHSMGSTLQVGKQ